MRIAILSDIHANREAFDAVLDAVGRLGVDETVLLGDIVGYGPTRPTPSTRPASWSAAAHCACSAITTRPRAARRAGAA